MNRLLYTIVNNGINLLQIIILVRVVMSWIPQLPDIRDVGLRRGNAGVKFDLLLSDPNQRLC